MYGLQYQGPDCSLAPFKLWVRIEVCYYAFNILFCYFYYRYVKKHRRESFKMMLFNCLLNVVHTGWLIYGNVCWFEHNAECLQEFSEWDDKNDP